MNRFSCMSEPTTRIVPRLAASPVFVGKSGMGPRGDALLQFDWTVGEIMGALEKAGIAENTLIVLSSDNGPVVDDRLCRPGCGIVGRT